MVKILLTTSAIFLIFCIGPVYGADFTAADKAFNKRESPGEGKTNIIASRKGYLQILKEDDLSPQEQIYTVNQLGRLAIYEADKFFDKVSNAGKQGRRKLLKQCWDGFMKTINPIAKNSGKPVDGAYGKTKPFVQISPVFFYYSATCLALYGEVSTLAENFINISHLHWFIDRGLELDQLFMGGGLLRILASIKSNSITERLGSYDPKKALELINKALNSSAYPGTSLYGADFCENYKRKSLILRELDRYEQAAAFIESTIFDFKEQEYYNDLPLGFEPETLACIQDMLKLKDGA